MSLSCAVLCCCFYSARVHTLY